MKWFNTIIRVVDTIIITSAVITEEFAIAAFATGTVRPFGKN